MDVVGESKIVLSAWFCELADEHIKGTMSMVL
jgi:hypothetical protein